jgi:hypothetical protein
MNSDDDSRVNAATSARNRHLSGPKTVKTTHTLCRRANKIGYKTMVNLAKGWYSAKNPAFAQVLPNLYPSVAGSRSKRIRVDRWKVDDWGDFFIDFWTAVHMKYRDSHGGGNNPGLWSVGRPNLLVSDALVEIQNAFFRNVSSQDDEFFEVSKDRDPKAKAELRAKLKRRAEKFLEWTPADRRQLHFPSRSLANFATKLGPLPQLVVTEKRP